MRGRRQAGVALGFAAACAAPLHAGSLKDHLVYTASLRLRGEWVDYFAPPGGAAPAGAPRYTFGASQLRGGLRATFPHVQLVLEAQDTRLLGLPEDASLAAPFGNLGPGATYYAQNSEENPGETFLKQATLTVRRSGLAAALGRFEYSDGLEAVPADPSLAWLKRSRLAERLIGPFGYTHVTRSFDGFRVSYDRGSWNATGVAVRPTRGGYDVRGNEHLGDVGLVGLSLTARPTLGGSPADVRAFYLFYDDARTDTLKVDNRPAAVRRLDAGPVRIHSAGGHFATVLLGRGGPGGLPALVHRADRGLGQPGPRRLGRGRRGRLAAAPAGVSLGAGGVRPQLGGRGPGRRAARDVLPGHPHAPHPRAVPVLQPHEQRGHVRAASRPATSPGAGAGRPPLAAPRGGAGPLVRRRRRHERPGLRLLRDAFGGQRSLARVAELSVAVRIHPRVAAYVYYGQASGQEVVEATFPGRRARYGYLEMTFRY